VTPSAKRAEAAAEQAPAAAKRTRPAARRPAAGASEEKDSLQHIGLHSLKPAPNSRRPRKRVGRGEGSGVGKTAGRGQKGYGSRSGAKSRARFEGGQMPIHMRMRKLRGPHMKKSMPFEMFRTHTQPVNISDLESRFDAGMEVTVELMQSKGLATRKGVPVKVLAKGELSKALTVHAHAFSAAARERIEAAGGSCHTLDG
jgi:large subunit ribosomal protein L15